MEYKTLGKTGLKVSRLCFGTLTFGREADEDTSYKLFERCREAGINFFDTANRYGKGVSETILGNCISHFHSREEIIISSKVGLPMSENINDNGLSRRHIINSIHGSLKRLGTDYIDIYFLHIYDHETPIEESLSTLHLLKQQGKILYIGVSNWAAWQIALGLGIAEKNGFSRIDCIQPMYSLIKRQAEVEIFPLAKEKNIGIMTYSPLAAGLLSGKYFDKNAAQGRIMEEEMTARRYSNPDNHTIARNFVQYAKDNNLNPAALAVTWVMANPVVTSPIIGARNINQLEQILASLEIKMTPERYKEITSLSISPPLATDRDEEKE